MSWGNFSLVVNSKFQPFSFERYIQPYQMYEEAYKEVENALGELATKASIWEKLANEQKDSDAYDMYKTYANDLEEKAGQLEREGLNAARRRDMFNMRARYSKEIVPIEQAYTTRQKQAEQQQQEILKDPDMMFSRLAANTSLNEYIRNPQLTYEAYSGEKIRAHAASAASALAKNMRENPRKWYSILHEKYFETKMREGYTTEEIILTSLNDPNAPKELRSIIEDAVSASNIASWNDKTTLDRAYDYARIGAWNALGKTQYQVLENWAAKAAAHGGTPDTPTKPAINPLNIYSSRELSKEEREYNDTIKNYSEYFDYVDGQRKMNEKGWKAYNDAVYIPGAANPTTPYTQSKGQYVESDFKKLIDRLGGKGAVSSDSYDHNQAVNVGKLWDKYVNDIPATKTAKYDATKVTEFDYAIARSQQQNMKDAIMTASRGLDLKEVDYNSKSGVFEDTGERLTMEELKKDEYKVTNTRFSPYGNTVMIQDGKGNVRRFELTPGINIINEQNRDARMEWVKILQDNRQGGTIRIPDSYARLMNLPIGTTITATPEQIQDEYNKAVEEAYTFHSQLLVQNETDEQNYYPRGY